MVVTVTGLASYRGRASQFHILLQVGRTTEAAGPQFPVLML